MLNRFFTCIILIAAFLGLLSTGCQKETNALAEVETSDAVVLNSDTVKVIGRVIADNGTPVTERGICWSKSDNPTLEDSKRVEGEGTGSFESIITGISLETEYHVRAFAINQAGTAYGNSIVFTLYPDLPAVKTEGYTPIDPYTVKIFGNVVSDNGAPVIERGVVYGQSENPTTSNNKVIEGEGTGLFECFITDLIPLTKYYARAYATNESGTAYGVDVIFITYMPLAFSEVETNAVNPTGPTSATVTANVITDNGTPVTERGVVWNVIGNPTMNDNKVVQGAGTGMYSCEITGLYPNTKYHVRAYAINQAGTSYGSDLLVQTPTSIIATILDQPIILRTIDSVRIFPDNQPECTDEAYAYPDSFAISTEVDVNNDQFSDYVLELIHLNWICTPINHCPEFHTYNLYMLMDGKSADCIFINNDIGNNYLFSYNDLIAYDASNTNISSGALIISSCDFNSPVSIYDKYIGIVINNRLGWIHIDRQNNFEVLIKGWAINTIPFAPIRAGQTE